VLSDIAETVRTGCWVGDCFIYTNSVNRLNYYVGGEIVTVAHLDRYYSFHNARLLSFKSSVCLLNAQVEICFIVHSCKPKLSFKNQTLY
jgi:hypothetical protein